MSRRLLLALVVLVAACGDSSDGGNGPGAGPYQVTVPYLASTLVGADSLADSVEVQIRSSSGAELEAGVWLHFSASTGAVSATVIQTDDQATAGISWRLAKPAAGANARLNLCVSRTQTSDCQSAGAITTHSGP